MADDAPVFGCDLYLLEKWDADAAVSDEEQMMQVFSSFVAMPVADRVTYTQAVKDRRLYRAADLPQADRDLLARVRPVDERQRFGYPVLLRTYYGPGSDAALATILDDHNNIHPGINTYLLSDAARYSFGDDWQRIFHRIPQLLEVGAEYEPRVERGRTRCIQGERQDRAIIEAAGYTWPDDALYLGTIYEDYHMVKNIGVVCILDETTLGDRWQEIDQLTDDDRERATHSGKVASPDEISYMNSGGFGNRFAPPYARRGPYWEKRLQERKMLSGWFDADGQLLRWNHLTGEEFGDELGCIICGMFDDHPIWTMAALDFDGLPDPDFDNHPVTEADLDPPSPYEDWW